MLKSFFSAVAATQFVIAAACYMLKLEWQFAMACAILFSLFAIAHKD